jgi:multidrug efflux pump subunit AcrA (membrane-fusion protein)
MSAEYFDLIDTQVELDAANARIAELEAQLREAEARAEALSQQRDGRTRNACPPQMEINQGGLEAFHPATCDLQQREAKQ